MATQSHPSPHRDRVRPPKLVFAVAGAALAWSLQLLVDYGLAAHRCFPADAPVMSATVPGAWAYPLVVAVNIAAILLAILSTLTARSVWNETRDEHDSPTHHLLAAGEGRTRFLAMCGQLAGIGFLIAILFDTPAIYLVPRCFG